MQQTYSREQCVFREYSKRDKKLRGASTQQKIRQLGTKKGASFSLILIETRSFVLGWFLFEKNLFGSLFFTLSEKQNHLIYLSSEPKHFIMI